MPFSFRTLVFAAFLTLAPGLQGVAHALPCAVAGAPTCDGECPASEMCVDVAYPGPPGGILCECVPTDGPCGAVEGPPLCYGDCPPTLSCFDTGGGCTCSITTPPVCGDGILQGAEECDDGNTSDGDGCSADCLIEGMGVPVLPESGLILLAVLLLGTSILMLRIRLRSRI